MTRTLELVVAYLGVALFVRADAGQADEAVRALINSILAIQQKGTISSEELIDINKKIEEFYSK